MASLGSYVAAADKDSRRLEVHKKTRLCKFFVAGACTRGSSCAFAHGASQLRDQPDFSKTRLCADFAEAGWCVAGQKCQFAHGKSELRPGSSAKYGRPHMKSPHEVPEHRAHEAAQVMQQRLRTLHEQTALKLLLQSVQGAACPAQKSRAPFTPATPATPGTAFTPFTKKADAELSTDPNDHIPFSRQSTWEGVETVSVGFSRASSSGGASEDACPSTPDVPAMPKLPQFSDVEVRVKNTFLEFHETDRRDSTPRALRRSRSLPSLLPEQ